MLLYEVCILMIELINFIINKHISNDSNVVYLVISAMGLAKFHKQLKQLSYPPSQLNKPHKFVYISELTNFKIIANPYYYRDY